MQTKLCMRIKKTKPHKACFVWMIAGCHKAAGGKNWKERVVGGGLNPLLPTDDSGINGLTNRRYYQPFEWGDKRATLLHRHRPRKLRPDQGLVRALPLCKISAAILFGKRGNLPTIFQVRYQYSILVCKSQGFIWRALSGLLLSLLPPCRSLARSIFG